LKKLQINENELHKTRRNLPHWQLGGSWYFITFRTKKVTLPVKAKGIVVESILHADGNKFKLAVATVMPDHVHLLMRPLEKEKSLSFSLQEILQQIKSFSAHEINKLMKRKGALWLDESFDRIIRDENDWKEKFDYIKNNAFKSGLTDKPENYPWLIEKNLKNIIGGTGVRACEESA